MTVGKSAAEVRRLFDKLYVELADVQDQLGKPSIATVGGSARGGGMTLTVSCDVLVAGQHATFGYPEIDLMRVDECLAGSQARRERAERGSGAPITVCRRVQIWSLETAGLHDLKVQSGSVSSS
jgi:1,4-dihydroxy-2-naphthoyl-CoA synthase